MELIAKTMKGLEEVLATELINLGANDVEIQRRAVAFSGDKALLYKANLQLRTALRILVPIAHFRAKDADEVYENVKKINWNKYMDSDTLFAIDSIVYSDDIQHSRFVTYRTKDAICDYFTEKELQRPSVSIDRPQLLINVHISMNRCTISLDSSGESLHKRGYRTAQNEAPISEVLAAGMLLLAGWKGETDFVDPMCGSGTFLIEAALIALNIPPGIYRPGFGFETWKDFDKELFDSLYQDDSGERPFEHHIYGSDISGRTLKLADENIKSAGLGKYITLEKSDVIELESPVKDKCLIVTNPPYGERLTSPEIYEIYSSLGSTLKHQFAGSTAWVISSDNSMLDRIGLKASKKIKLLNGALECSYNKYEMFSGKRKDTLNTSAS